MKYLWKCFLAAAVLSLQAVPALAQGPAPAPAAPMMEAPIVNCCEDACCRRGGFIGGAELLLLKPYNSEGIAPIFDTVIEVVNEVLPVLAAGQPALNEPDFDLEPGFRLWGGWQNADGLGLRITYFDWDNDADANTAFNLGGALGINTLDIGFDYAIEARALDVEVIQSFHPNECWNLIVGGGFRWAEYQETNSLNIGAAGPGVPGGAISLPGLLQTGFDSDSYGLTLSGEARRRIGNFALFVGSRVSVLFGDEDEFFRINATALGLPADVQAFINQLLTESEEDNIKFIYELRMGAEYNRELRNGAVGFARITAEAQYWDNVTGTPVFNSSGAFGLFGLGLGVGVYR